MTWASDVHPKIWWSYWMYYPRSWGVQTAVDVPDLDRALLDVIYALRSLAGNDPSLRPKTDRFNRRLHKLRHDIANALADLAKP